MIGAASHPLTGAIVGLVLVFLFGFGPAIVCMVIDARKGG